MAATNILMAVSAMFRKFRLDVQGSILFFNIYICDLFFCIVDLDIGSYTGGNTLYICFADLDFTLKKVKRL